MRKKHKTPKHLDRLFERKVITRGMYGDFWGGYWESRNRSYYTDRFLKEVAELPDIPYYVSKKTRKISFRTKAQRSAAAKKGWITRRKNARKANSRMGRRNRRSRSK